MIPQLMDEYVKYVVHDPYEEDDNNNRGCDQHYYKHETYRIYVEFLNPKYTLYIAKIIANYLVGDLHSPLISEDQLSWKMDIPSSTQLRKYLNKHGNKAGNAGRWDGSPSQIGILTEHLALKFKYKSRLIT